MSDGDWSSAPLLESLSPGDRSTVAAFAEALEKGTIRSLDAYMDSHGRRGSPRLVAALACVEMEHRWKAMTRAPADWESTLAANQQPSSVADYLKAFPELRDEPECVVELIAVELDWRRRNGEEAPASEYVEKFPHLTDSIERRLVETDRYRTIWHDPGASDGPKPDETVSLARSIDASTHTPDGRRDRPPARKLHAGQREFGDYILQEEIARGGMGVVYRAVQKRLNRTVAIKMILSGNLASEQEVRRFYTEAEAAAHLDHPGIVPIYEVNEVRGQHYFSMGYVDGESLADRLQKGPLPPREAAEIVRQTAQAIAYAHAQGVVHRDLKPSNILMTKDGRPRVTDFGLAKTVQGDSNLTASGQVLGTPNYMPPEQALGDIRAVGPHSDVYSLGAVLYCLVTARPPFQAATPVETLRQVIEREPARPRLLNGGVDVDLETICLKCLEKDKTHRIESAAELAAELERYLKGEAIRSRRIGPVTRSWRWVKRNRAVAASIALLLVLVAAIPLGLAIWRIAAESRELTTASNAVEAKLDQVELTPEYLETSEALISHVNELSPEMAGGFRGRLLEAWSAAIDRSLRRPRLRDADIEQVETALALLEERDPGAAPPLRDLLAQRKLQSQEVFRLAPPFAQASAVFASGEVEARGGKLYPIDAKPAATITRASAPPVKTVGTVIPCRARSQLTAQFDENWEQGIEIGLSLNHAEGSGYDFVLFAVPRVTADAELPLKSAHAPAAARPTFAAVRQAGDLVVEIRRNGSPAQRREMPLAEVPPGPLRLWVKRDGGRVRLQINQGETIEFLDPFPLTESRAGVFAVRWPEQAGLLSLAASEELQAGAVTPLEQADVHFEEGRYDEALAIYTAQAVQLSDPEFQQEARFKRGLCLVRLNRTDEAIQTFQPLLSERGDRWPPQAGVQLWLVLLRQNQHADADAVYELLASRYTFAQLALMVPAEVRNEILQSYLREMQSLQTVLSYRPERLRNLERAAAIDRLLSYDGRGEMMTQLELSRGYRYMDDLESALQIIEPFAHTTSHSVPWRHYLRVLRHLGQHEKALAECDRWLAAPDHDAILPTALINRACIHAARQDWKAAEADVLAGLEIFRQRTRRSDEPSYLYLMAGFLCEQRGDEPGAQAWWREGFLDQRWVIGGDAVASTGYVNVLLLGALCGELTDDEAFNFVQKAIGGVTSPIAALALQFVNRQVIGDTARKAIAMPRGRQIARDFTFDAFSLSQRIQAPLKLGGAQFAAQTALGGNLWPEQEEILWTLGGEGYRQFTIEGTLTTPQVMQLGFAWKGTSNLLGWQGVAPTLDPPLRAPLAYVLAHRYVRLGDLTQAEKLLQTTLRDAPPEEALAKLAQEELQLLQAKQARLRIEHSPAGSAADPPLEIILRRDGQEVQRVSIADKTEIDVEPGRYELSLDPPNADLVISPARVNLVSADRALVTVEYRWRHPPAEAALPGLLAEPADLPGVGRWQVISAEPWGGIPTMAYSPDGQWLAVAGAFQDGVVRIYDRQLRLAAALPATTKYLRKLSWSPDGARLAIAGQDPQIDLWDPAQARIVGRLAGAKSGAMCVAWSPQGDRIVSGHGDDSLCLWSSQGKLLSVQKPQWSDVVHSLAWRHDGSEVVFAALGGPGFGRWDMANNAIEPLTGAEGGEFRGLAFSPDGSRLAALASQGVEIWEWPSRQRLRTFPIAVSSLSPVLWTPDGKSVWVRTQGAALRFEIDSTSDSPAETYAIGGDGALAIDPQTGLLTAVRWSGALTPPGSDAAAATAPPPMAIQAIRHIAFHPTGERIVVAGEPRRVRWFDRHGKLLHEVETPGHPRTVAHSADGALVAVPCDNGMLRLHSDADGALVREWKAHQAPAQAAAFDPTGQRIATCGEDKTVKLWTITGEPLMLEQGEAPRGFNLELLAFSPDGSRLLAASGAGNILLWDNDGRLLSEFQVERQIRAVAWRGDGKKFVLAGSNALRVFSTDGQKEGTITDRVGVPLTCAWTPSHDLIAIDEPGNIRLWSEAGDLRDEWQTSVGGWKLAGFDPTASQVVLSRERGRLESWRLADRRPVFTCILVDDKHFHFDGRGRLQNDNATDISPLTYLVETPDGFRMLNHEEFQKQVYGAP